MLTKLEAVNHVLDAIGEDPVSSLSSGLPDAEKAERALDRVSKEVQTTGWHCNTEKSYRLAPDASGKIFLSSTVLTIDTVGRSAIYNVVPKEHEGKRALYNVVKQTFAFTTPLYCDIVFFLDFESLTPALQMYIAAKAAREFQESEMGSAALDKFRVRKELEAWTQLQDAEAEAEDTNVLNDSPDLTWARKRW